MNTDIKIAIIGLGYVGLPLAVEFGRKYLTLGFDVNKNRINELVNGIDSTQESSKEDLANATKLTYITNPDLLAPASVYIVSVPTPIDGNQNPNLNPVISATKLIAKYIDKGDIVIYESTVYPGATEEICVPILEETSGLIFNKDFYCGYSPERINPGDKKHHLTNILKITSGSTPEIATCIDELYQSIINAGTHKASSIKVAEAAKVIENIQRDVNIALMNELALIFHRIGIDTEEVLEAAGTKWNFLPFRPGLVGGHCIGIDPYYLLHKAKSLGYNPELISASRRINNNMGLFVISEIVKLMATNRIHIVNSNILILGLTFKENCPDLRNTRVVEMIDELNTYEANVEVYDPWANKEEAKLEYNLDLIDKPKINNYDAIIVAVSHDQFKKMGIESIKSFAKEKYIIYDIKYLLDHKDVQGRL